MCPVFRNCGVSVRRTPAPALRCARCPCRPFHRACAPPGSPGARACPQCAQASVVPFAGALTRPAAGPGAYNTALPDIVEVPAGIMEERLL